MASKTKKKEGIWETIKTVFWALVIAGLFRTLFFQPFWIPSGSMKDTLLVGDFLFVNKMAYGYGAVSCPFSVCPIPDRILGSEPERGDVVVFRHPVQGVDFIKRVVGLPGDRIQMRDGVLWINGAEAPQTPDGIFTEPFEQQGPGGEWPRCANNPQPGGVCEVPRFTETLPNGRSHDVLNITDDWVSDNTPEFTVPEGQYFFVGDNRDNSMDSRFAPQAGGVGFVPAKYLIGRADRIIFSSAGASLLYFWTWRGDRFFKAVH
ncbi:MAG: signal peptidase I [Paracoccus sp. (in: a-proteobacteria)]|uniref:signal peptidase I n=1 Tax=Paracoccus sp. TaxID=267 RepID=UPI0026E0FE55|nr:signal peptidase I [Paracoccus sp. (in: a-proteobacteria)]MDO5620048.1 signal peptidase I [Paracoccus sp. (in: a-proteobacteria)]